MNDEQVSIVAYLILELSVLVRRVSRLVDFLNLDARKYQRRRTYWSLFQLRQMDESMTDDRIGS